jgi:diguanylate cyclase (GGDEF)-like protein
MVARSHAGLALRPRRRRDGGLTLNDDPMDGRDSAERMRAQQVALVFGQTLRNQALSPFVAALLSFALWQVADHGLLVGWMLTLAGVSVWRQGLARLYHRRPVEGGAVRAWERRFLLSLAVASAVWGIGGWLVMPMDSDAHQALVYCFLLGMAGGTSALYAAHGPSVVLAVTLMMAPITLFMLTVRDIFHGAMAIGGIVFVAAATRSVRLINEALRRNIELARDLERLAHTDPLSGLSNRRAFTEIGATVVANAARAARSCALLMVDVDRFKAINDRLGHAAGDDAIRGVGAVLAGAIRTGELAGRLGGDEFAVILPDAGHEAARALAGRILTQARTLHASAGETHAQVTVSIGVAASGGAPCSFDTLLARADTALYEAKRQGRDRVVVAPEIADGTAPGNSGDTNPAAGQ